MVNRSVVFAAFTLLLVSIQAFATPQRPDILLFEGKEYPITPGLLDPYFDKHPDRHPNKFRGRHSSLARGYIATFEIADDALFLKDISTDGSESAIRTVIPERVRLKIGWYTGLLLSGHGGLLWSVNFDFLEGFEKYTIFEINSGSFRRVKHFDRKSYLWFCERQYEAFKKTPGYKTRLKELSANGRSLEMSDEIIRESIVSITKKLLVD